MEVTQHLGRREVTAQYVDPEGVPGDPYRCDRLPHRHQDGSRVREEGLSLPGEDGTRGHTPEQRDTKVRLKCRDAFGHRLLRHPETGGRMPELSLFRHGDEGAHGLQIHPGDASTRQRWVVRRSAPAV